jgi:hypothetical protein
MHGFIQVHCVLYCSNKLQFNETCNQNRDQNEKQETQIFTWKPLREKTTDSQRRILTMMEEYYKHETTYRLWCDYWGIYMTALYKSPWRTRNEIYSYALASVHKAHY